MNLNLKQLASRQIILSLFIFVLGFSQTGKSQNLLDENNLWNVVYLPVFTPDIFTISYRFEGDTTINNLTYKHLWESFDELNQVWEPTYSYYRESADKKIYRASFDFTNEFILYDFNLMVGDTFFLNDNQLNLECNLIVHEIDSVMINNSELRKRLTFVDADDVDENIVEIWIEGIGSLDGVVTPLAGYCANDWNTELLCYNVDGSLAYPANPETCFLITNIKELSSTDKIKIYPNPAKKQIFISTEDAQNHLQKATVYNSIGEIVFHQNLTSDVNEIDISNLPIGVYYVTIEVASGAIFSSKLMKVE